MNLKTEKNYQKQGITNVFGLDEVGRGPLAGPVCTCAVWIDKKPSLPINFINQIKDSKKLSPKKRKEIFEQVPKFNQIHYGISFVSNKTIDKIGIQKSIFKSFKNSITNLIKKSNIKPNLVLIDGNQQIPNLIWKQKTIIKGDDKVFSIALASVIAKHTRDTLMIKLSKKYPKYNFEIHKGYGTKKHIQLIKKHGQCEIHRKSFKF